MTWNFNQNLDTAKDQIRSIVGDTDKNDQLISDEEIAFYITQADNIWGQAELVANAIAAKFARDVNSKVESVSINGKEKFEQYVSLAANLREKSATQGGGIGS